MGVGPDYFSDQNTAKLDGFAQFYKYSSDGVFHEAANLV
jgi:hypothetical protein